MLNKKISKLKEIYAPKLQEFAYVTDGACSEVDILKMELSILKVMLSFLSCNFAL